MVREGTHLNPPLWDDLPSVSINSTSPFEWQESQLRALCDSQMLAISLGHSILELDGNLQCQLVRAC
eukprot:5694638-Amphidinium_carterae.1